MSLQGMGKTTGIIHKIEGLLSSSFPRVIRHLKQDEQKDLGTIVL